MLPLLMFNVIAETIKDNLKGLMNLPNSQSDSSSSVYFVNFNQDCTFNQRQENSRKIGQLFIFFFALTIPSGLCVQLSCPFYSRAFVKDNCAGCGVCQLDYDKKDYFCYYEHQQYFSGPGCKPYPFCKIDENRDKCNKFGCQDIIGDFKCRCHSNKYGMLCQHDMIAGSSSKDYTIVDDVIFDPIVSYGQYVTVSLIISNVGKNMEIQVYTSLEHLSFNSKMCIEVSKTHFCKKWFKDLPNLCKNNPNIKTKIKCAIILQFFFLATNFVTYESPINMVHGDIKDTEENIANKNVIKISVTNHIQNQMTFPVFYKLYKVIVVLVQKVTENSYFCDPLQYEMRNAGTDMYEPEIFNLENEIVITTSYQLNSRKECASVDNINIHWSVWKIGINHNELLDRPFKEVFKDPFLSFQPFTLEQGKYKVICNISVWKGYDESYDFLYGYFEVIELQLLPFISGGKERSVYYNINNLTLNGEFSRDPNIKPAEQKGNLKFYWKCDKPFDICKEKHSDYSISYSGPFQKNETYTFYLTVISVLNKKRQATTSQRIYMSPSTQNSVEIICKKNCGQFSYESNPGYIIYLEAVVVGDSSKMQVGYTFDWFYSTLRENIFKSADEIRQKYTPHYILIVKKNSLLSGETYSFQVKDKNGSNAGATFDIQMANKIGNFSCSLNINMTNSVVLRGITKLEVVCERFKFRSFPPVYNFYDKYADADDKGRLIASGQSNNASNVVLTRGKLVVEISNEYGMAGLTEITVKLKSTENETEIIKKELENLKRNGSTSGAEFRINTISVILDLLPVEIFGSTYYCYIIEEVLKLASEDIIASVSVLKLWTDLVNRIAKEHLTRNLTTKSINYLSKSITKLSTKLLYEIKGRINETKKSYLNDNVVNSLAVSMLQICNAISNSSNKGFIKTKKNEESVYNLFRESSNFLVRAVGRIMLCLALTIMPHQSAVVMKENHIRIWIKEDNPESFSVFRDETLSSVTISKTLATSLSKTFNFVVVLAAEYDQNPYWYNEDIDIQTNAVDFQIRYKKGINLPIISDIPHPIIINLHHMKTETIYINGSVCQPNLNESRSIADLAVAVHELRIPYIGRLVIQFMGLEEDHVLRVRVLFNLRPDIEFMMEKNVKLITKSSPTLMVDLRDPHSYDIYDLYFIGIFPDVNVPVGKCINYSFQMSASHCVTWKFHEWSTGGCKVKEIGVNSSNELRCECEHLSTFAGFVQVPINTIDPFSDYKLFLGLKDNPFVFIFISFILSLYLILLIWALRTDYKQKLKGDATYLEDNFPRDNHPYLIAVYTGSKLFSGTTSNVAILVEGEDSCSRIHVLKSSFTPVLQTGDDNWFLIFTPSHLGPLTMIHIWTDYSGKRPEWYCHKVMVVDLLTYKEYTFFVEAWLSLKGDDFVERFVEVSKPHDDNRLNAAIENLVLGFRETHLWVSVLARHPRSKVTRAQRLSLAFTGLLVTMLVSCMFYQVLDERQEDYPKFTLSIREFIIGVISLVISSVLINIVVSLFRRRLVMNQYEEYSGEIEDIDDSDKKKRKTKKIAKSERGGPLKRFFEDVLNILSKPKKFKPVLINIEAINSYRKKSVCDFCWSTIAWTICISLVIICSYLIVLYGLKFGKVKSLEWLSTVVLSLLQVIFLVAPFRIISLATVSGLLSSKMYEVISYRINPQHLKECQLRQESSNQNLDSKLINIRRQHFYVPLRFQEMMKKFYKQKRKDATWVLFDAFLIFFLVILMFIQNETLWTTKYYWNNYQLRSLLKHGLEEDGVQLYSLYSLSLNSLIMEEQIFSVIYQGEWYNGLPITNQKGTKDFTFVFSGTSKLFGLPRLRQIRLKPGLCQKPLYQNLSNYCNMVLSKDTEDTDLYAEGWVSTGPLVKFVELSPWNYVSESDTYDTTLIGYSNKAYQGDGYVADLDKTKEKSEDIVITLHREKWLDRLTCVVFFELTVYNAFSGTFSWLVFVTENLHMGLFLNKVYIYTVSDEYNPIIDIVFFASLLTFTVRVFFRVNRNGINKLIYNFCSIVEIIIVCLAIVCAVLYIFNINTRLDYLKKFMTGNTREEYFQYFHLLKYLFEFRAVLVFLVVILACRFMWSLKLGKTFNTYFLCIFSGCKLIVWLCIIIIITVYMHWRLLSYLINNYSLSLSKSNFIIVSKFDFKQIISNCRNVACKISPYILCCVSYGLQRIIIAHLIYLYRILKRTYSEQDNLNFCTVFCEKYEESGTLKDTERKSKLWKPD